MSDSEDDYLGHPDSAIRLASAVHRFKVPRIDGDQGVSFKKSFKTTGTHPKTKTLITKVRIEFRILTFWFGPISKYSLYIFSMCTLILKADDARQKLASALAADRVSHERVLSDSTRYLPFIHQILLSCKVQPEVARLDGK